jgi:hypothetical protein
MTTADYVTLVSGLILAILVLAPPAVRIARLIRES